MFRLEHTEFLYGLLFIPLLIVAFWWSGRARLRALRTFGHLPTVTRLLPNYAPAKRGIKFTLFLIGWVCLLIAAANPQFGTRKERVKRKSVDVFVAIDVSRSMLAEDLLPNRLDRAKQFTIKLIDELKGNRIGTIAFAGNAYLQMPLTSDYAAAQVFVRSASPDMAPTQGTAIGEAVQMANRAFDHDDKTHKALIVITDGEDHDSDALHEVTAAAAKDILVFTVGIGSAAGAKIPDGVENGVPRYKIDESGKTIVSRINEPMLRELAAAGKGAYYNLTDNEQITASLKKAVDKLEKREFETRMFSEYESYYQYFAFLGLLCLCAELAFSYRTSNWWVKRDIFSV